MADDFRFQHSMLSHPGEIGLNDSSAMYNGLDPSLFEDENDRRKRKSRSASSQHANQARRKKLSAIPTSQGGGEGDSEVGMDTE